MVRRAARVDANHAEIVKAARSVGASVADLSAVGSGCPDLLIGLARSGQNYLVEVKDGSKSPSRRVLTPDQAQFHREWQGPICVIESVEQLFRLLGVK